MELKNNNIQDYIDRFIFMMKKSTYLFLIFVLLSGCSKESNQPDDPLPPPNPPDTTETDEAPYPEPQEGDFTLAVIPDTQYYVGNPWNGGTPDMFYAQTDWIQDNQKAENIVYVAHLGDICEDGDDPEFADRQWRIARNAMYRLEDPVNIPYGLAVGNHDQSPIGYAEGTTINYNENFGVEHFEDCTYYGGHYGDNNDNHYDLFSAGGEDFIAIYLEYDVDFEYKTALQDWTSNILDTYSSREAIIVSHYIIGKSGNFGPQGRAIYELVKTKPNVFMMLSGHIGGEGYGEYTYNGNTIRTFLSDYQGHTNGGNGLMRLYKISVENNTIDVKTYSPYTDEFKTDGNSEFTVPLFGE